MGTAAATSTRLDRLTASLAEAELDLMLVTDLVNVRYLTGYTGSNGLALIGPESRRFVTDFRYVEQAAAQVEPSFDRVEAPRDLLDVVTDLLPAGTLRIGFEDANLSVRDHEALLALMPERVSLVAAPGIVERLRAVKDDAERALMRSAAKLADEAFSAVVAPGLAGRTERDVALALETEMVCRGAEHASFDTIVAAGEHGALPHAKPRDVEIRPDDLVVVDWGARLDGYCSDCTRTLAVGEPAPEAREAYELALAAQLAGLGAVRAGAGCREVDAVARDVIAAGGHGPHFGHGLGHGVGLDIHEGPRLSQRAEGDLVAGNVVTVEPGVYVPGAFGVRIEDLVAVTAEGCEVFTSLGKELTIVD
jgi:Xaa-Pro aminopeptidase